MSDLTLLQRFAIEILRDKDDDEWDRPEPEREQEECE